jgi:hypothetical protein
MRPYDDAAPRGPDEQLHQVAHILAAGLRRLGRPKPVSTAPSLPQKTPRILFRIALIRPRKWCSVSLSFNDTRDPRKEQKACKPPSANRSPTCSG